MIYHAVSKATSDSLAFDERMELTRMRVRRHIVAALHGILVFLATSPACYSQFDIEEAPFEYSKTQDDNLVTRLIAKVESGETSLEYDRDFGYLQSVLTEFDISRYSQGLVFSKTSLQVGYISTRNPRAIYFNDDIYVGWVRGSGLLEISTSDAKLGAAFYSAEQTGGRPHIRRRNYECLACHTTSMTQGIPGHTVRSVFPKHNGSFDFRRESFVTDHTSPIAKRWGGWYVTGGHGEMQHIGNAIFSENALGTKDNANLTDLRNRLFTLDWLTPYSDIVALMVLEHQTQMHNTFTRNNFAVRRAIFENQQSDKTNASDLEKELAHEIESAAKDIVNYMLFLNEAPLTDEIKPSTRFDKVFADRGPASKRRRSLRALNLKSRLFEYPCSYMIYSHAFETLEPALRDQVYRRLWATLNNDESSDDFKHLSSKLRREILEIIRDTKTDLPEFWSFK